MIKTSASNINLKSYGAIGDGNSPEQDQEAWTNALADIPADGGTLFIPNGHYRLSAIFHRDNVHLLGESRNGVLIDSQIPGDNGIELSVYRRGGWVTRLDELTPYKDTLNVGQHWIEPQDPADLAKYEVGDKIFIAAGSSMQFDQEHGEFNRIKYITATRLYLEKGLLNDYGTDVATWNALIEEDFTPAPVGVEFDIQVRVLKDDGEPGALRGISIGNDLYEFLNSTSTNVETDGKPNSNTVYTWTVRSVRNTNGTDLVQANTKVYKQRVIIKTPETSYGNIIENLTVKAAGDTINLSNSMNTEIRNVTMLRTRAGGLWMDGDDGRDARFRNCKMQSEVLKFSQPARSFAEMSFRDCEFIQSTVGFTEFCKNCEIIGCNFSAFRLNDEDDQDPRYQYTDTPAISLGWTTSNIRIERNTIHGDNVSVLIDTFPDINGYRAAWRGAMTIKDNHLYGNNTEYIIRTGQLGNAEISGNKMYGRTMAVFGISGHHLDADSIGTTNAKGTYIHSSHLNCHHNQFIGYLNIANYGEMHNIIFKNNYFHCLGDVRGSNDDKGNIVWDNPNGNTYPNVEMVIIKDNIFKNWLYRDENASNPNPSINYQGPKSARVNISNNLFLNPREDGEGISELIVDTYIHPK